MRKTFAILLLLAAAMATPAFAQKKPVKKGFKWNNRPTVVFGKDTHIDLRIKYQGDLRMFDPDLSKEKVYDFRSMRVGLKGELTKHFEFEVERRVSREWEAGSWKDVYLMWKTYDKLTLQGGRFKMPFGN